VKDGLDVMTIRIEHERGVVVLAVRSFSRSSVVAAARGESGGVKGVHLRGARRREGDVTRESRLSFEPDRERLVLVAAVPPIPNPSEESLSYTSE